MKDELYTVSIHLHMFRIIDESIELTEYTLMLRYYILGVFCGRSNVFQDNLFKYIINF